MSVIYEVNLAVNSEIQDRFGIWLTAHIQEMLELPGFESADWWQVEEENHDSVQWSVHYKLVDRVALERYFSEFAAGMRGDGLSLFGDQFSASRRILLPVKS